MKRLWLLFVLFPLGASAQSGKKLDLDDMIIKGELHNDDRLLMLSRGKNEMKNYVRFRQNFREEIIQQLPERSPRKKFSN